MLNHIPIKGQIRQAFLQLRLPRPDSHKGQNGKLLIIGGSNLFHAASKWSLDIASKFVDMVFYSSVPINNQLIKEAKANFWNGIVVPRLELKNYIAESDCILIGPGMQRSQKTKKVVDKLLAENQTKKWVIDAGALQMVEPQLLNQRCIITPHQRELERLTKKTKSKFQFEQPGIDLVKLSQILKQTTILLKGPVDLITNGQKLIPIAGGNAGLTKGGTGDTLAGLVAALYCQHDRLTSCLIASVVNKQAGEHLYQTAGTYYNASDLVQVIPQVIWQLKKQMEGVSD